MLNIFNDTKVFFCVHVLIYIDYELREIRELSGKYILEMVIFLLLLLLTDASAFIKK